MIPKQAIEKAIEGGLKEGEKWKFVGSNKYWAIWLDGNGNETPIAINNYIVDPTFWQSLEKALEWKGFMQDSYNKAVSKNWMNVAEKFFHLILAGSGIDEFWKEILKNE